MNNNNNNHKENKRGNRQFKRSTRTRGKRYTSTHKIYKYTMRTPIISYVSPTYTQQNLKIEVFDLLQGNPVFDKLFKMYNQYKLRKIVFAATPRIQQARDPAPVWIYLDTEGHDTEFNYTALPELQGSRSLPVKHFSLTTYRTSGRQKDFNYWEDFSEMKDGLAIRLHCAELPTGDPQWQFQLQFYISVRGMKLQSSNTKEQEEKITAKKLESLPKVEQELPKEKEEKTDKKKIKKEKKVKKKVGEDDDKVWDEQDSDWE